MQAEGIRGGGRPALAREAEGRRAALSTSSGLNLKVVRHMAHRFTALSPRVISEKPSCSCRRVGRGRGSELVRRGAGWCDVELARGAYGARAHDHAESD